MSKFYFCRNPKCSSRPWQSVESVERCPTCGSSMIHCHRVEWAHVEDYGGFLDPSPEQVREKEGAGK